MNLIFRIVADSLEGIAAVTGFTYNEINIIAYYIILPFIYVALLDRILKKHFLKISYLAAWGVVILLTPNFRAFSDTLFDYSVDFLLLFRHVGLNYVAASVVLLKRPHNSSRRGERAKENPPNSRTMYPKTPGNLG